MKNKSKREFLKSIGSAGVFLAGANLPVWAINTSASAATSGSSYKLLKPDQNGLMLMKGFTSRVVATTMKKTLSYRWHPHPDGGATFPTEDGGWIYVSNSESEMGGVGALRFNSKAEIVKSYSICRGTSTNCAGGPTPWNTWLTCEEYKTGFTWECDPYGRGFPEKIRSLGMFQHEAAAVDPKTSIIYQTEDTEKSGFYRFVPEKKINAMGELSMAKGKFQVMEIESGGKVKWNDVNDPLAKKGSLNLMKRKPNKKIKYKAFNRGEGAWYHDGKVHFATTGNHQIWTYDIANETCKVLYKGKGKLKYPDNVTVSNTGLVMAAEDGGNMEICGISNKTNEAFPIVRIKGHKNSEVTGPAFDPSGTRLYFSSQRGKNGFTGITYEVTGPFDTLT